MGYLGAKPLTHSPDTGMGEKIRKEKVRKLTWLRQRQFNR